MSAPVTAQQRANVCILTAQQGSPSCPLRARIFLLHLISTATCVFTVFQTGSKKSHAHSSEDTPPLGRIDLFSWSSVQIYIPYLWEVAKMVTAHVALFSIKNSPCGFPCKNSTCLLNEKAHKQKE